MYLLTNAICSLYCIKPHFTSKYKRRIQIKSLILISLFDVEVDYSKADEVQFNVVFHLLLPFLTVAIVSKMFPGQIQTTDLKVKDR